MLGLQCQCQCCDKSIRANTEHLKLKLLLDHNCAGLEGVVFIKPASPCDALRRIIIWVSFVQAIKMCTEATEINC